MQANNTNAIMNNVITLDAMRVSFFKAHQRAPTRTVGGCPAQWRSPVCLFVRLTDVQPDCHATRGMEVLNWLSSPGRKGVVPQSFCNTCAKSPNGCYCFGGLWHKLEALPFGQERNHVSNDILFFLVEPGTELRACQVRLAVFRRERGDVA